MLVRNELYNAYGAITDREDQLRLVSPCSIDKIPNWVEDGTIFAELGISHFTIYEDFNENFEGSSMNHDNVYVQRHHLVRCTVVTTP
jgi:hypothetical protein